MSNAYQTSYGKKLGYKPISGKEAEFESAAEELFSARFSMRFAVFNGTDADVEAVRKRIIAAEDRLAEYSSKKGPRTYEQ